MKYDIAILGAGLSGVSLVLTILQSSLKNKKILIVEPTNSIIPYRRTWSYWIKEDHVFSPAVEKRWDSISIADVLFQRELPLKEYRMEYISSDSLFRYAYNMLKSHKNITVEHYEARPDDIDATYVFDSRPTAFDTGGFAISGWSWKISTRTFFKDSPTLFDFRNTPHDRFAFFYLLPFSKTSAVITLTQYAYPDRRIRDKDAHIYLNKYLSETLHLKHSSLGSCTFGFIPLATRHSYRKKESRVFPIGVRAGLMNSLSSYAFSSIIHDSRNIVDSLIKTGSPYFQPVATGFPGINRAMKRIMHRQPYTAKKMFIDLFRTNNNADEILSFISQDEPFNTYFHLVRHMNPLPLLRGIVGI